MSGVQKSRTTILVLANAWGPLYSVHGIAKYRHLGNLIGENTPASKLQIESVVNPLFNPSSIESRSATFRNIILDRLEKLKTSEVHVIGLGLAGIDLRYALQSDKHVAKAIKTLVTINSPHKGSMLSTLHNNKRISIPTFNEVLHVLGVEESSFLELNQDNMNDFNDFLEEEEAKRDNVYSVDSILQKGLVSPLLSETAKAIHVSEFSSFADTSNDGLFRRKECQHSLQDKSRHLLTFEGDLPNMFGLGGKTPEGLPGFLRDFLINRV